MKIIKLLLVSIFIILANHSECQRIGNFQFDSTSCIHKVRSINPQDKYVLNALSGAEKFLKSILGSAIVKNNIWFDCFQSREIPLINYSTDFKNPKNLVVDTCYDFYFLVKQEENTIGYFQLLTDRNGTLRFDDSYPDDNRFELIKGFKKHFSQDFKFDYGKAMKLGKEKGFIINPQLQCKIENKFLTNTEKQEFVKIKYIWSFYSANERGDTSILNVNAETGVIERESYVPGISYK